MSNRTRNLLLAVYTLGILSGCQHPKQEPARQPENTFSIKGGVHEMSIWPVATEFPEHAGKAEFVSYCGICHSLRYISTQPDFPRKTWDAEVTKMITKYHAPIDSVTGKKIVEYLVAIKSKH